MPISLSDLRKSYDGRDAVAGVTVDIEAGEFFVVLGPSGCGKSTLLRLIAGLERPDGGEVKLDGNTVSAPGRHLPPEDRDVGVVFQSYALWPHMDVRDNVAFPIESAGRARNVARSEAETHLRTVALTEFAARKPAELSGGQRQRVALARCLAGGAKTILMDEPLANLDPHLRASMEEEIAAFHARAGATTIYITHDQREAMALATRVAVMGEGRFLQVATPEDLHDRPATAEVARFIGRSALLPGVYSGSGHARVAAHDIAVNAPEETALGPVTLVIRPNDVRLGEGPLRGRLDRVFYRGGMWEALVEVDGLGEALPVSSRRRLANGEVLDLSITGGWVLPEPPSEAPGHHAGGQSTPELVE
ncbi:iron(III) transport system ATP-binding protein [Roseivivax halotolerans]|uniref:Iron(III) transport system ATP-binding protein n=1 Tax=Roseivivax halotolerans TaxID=93684 RepID=A0A1I6AAB7_9RHOB|nr:ABC transporter ATP-binding protein [Roseivivax halotolerans]SFQ65619.1 iron(III) transport system ATP-binding protein [Roseivivax halotolerans]